VFVVPPEAFKSKRAHVVILNDAAWSIVESQRKKHPIWVFPYRGKPIGTMNNTAWQSARRLAGLTSVRVHDLETYVWLEIACRERCGRRPRRAAWSCLALDARFYASPDIGRLISLSNRVLDRTGSVTTVRVACA